MSRNALGRGLSALLPETRPAAKTPPPVPQPSPEAPGPTRIPVEKVRPSRYQPRQNIDPEAVRELAESIKVHGLLQPIIVTFDAEEDEYELIAGERRLEATKFLGMKTVPALIKDVDDEARLERGLIEIIQRADRNPIEEAQSYRLLMDRFQLTQEQISERLGKKRTTVANMLRLLHLPEDIQVEIASGDLSAGHAKALAGIEDPELLREAIDRIRRSAFTVRQTEEWLRSSRTHSGEKKKKSRGKSSSSRVASDPHIRSIEDSMQDLLGVRVHIHTHQDGGGRIEIEYYTEDDLNNIISMLGVDVD
jgi:ParB family chromosome partitioning protein